MTEEEFQEGALDFLAAIFEDLKHARVEIPPHWDIDHLCWRTDSVDNYQDMKRAFCGLGVLLVESEVGGRMISTFKLHRAIFYREWQIELLELPAPKRGKATASGLEHLEVVCDVPFSELIEKYKHLQLDKKGLSKDLNRELEICMGTRNIKFHHVSLEAVIRIESDQKVWRALSRSGILNSFSRYRPLLIGPSPLQFYLFSGDLDEAEKDLFRFFSGMAHFNMEKTGQNKLTTVFCSFIFDGVPFEVSVQNREPVNQSAYVNYLRHERRQKYGFSR